MWGGPYCLFDVALSRSKPGPQWRAGLSRVGLRSGPKPGAEECLIHRIRLH